MNSKENHSRVASNCNTDEDSCSNYSGSHVSCSSEPKLHKQQSHVEEQPIRVRDMINLYNFATQKNQELAHAKSIYFGVNNASSQAHPKCMSDALDEPEQDQEQEEVPASGEPCCHGGCNCSDCFERTETRRVANSTLSPTAANFRVSTSGGQTSVLQTSLLQSPEAGAAAGEAAVEKSYQSKTTIRRTEHGVRIIIDIFFDKDSNIDIVGSRVETDIPESRILADFQQQALLQQQQDTNV